MNGARSHGISYRIFLPDGNPDGIRVVERSGWSGIAFMCGRPQLPQLRKRPEMARTGVYLLITPGADNPDHPSIYIGEADGLAKRLGDHDAGRDDWTHVIAFTSKDGSLHKAHAKTIESRLVTQAQMARRSVVENRVTPPAASLHEADLADVEAFIEEMLVIYPLLGVRAFEATRSSVEPAGSEQDGSIENLELNVGAARGKGAYRPEGFVVFEGALAATSTTDSLNAGSEAARERLKKEGILQQKDDLLVLTADQTFNSPSQAAEVLLGYPVSGLIKWKDNAGRTLKDILAARSN